VRISALLAGLAVDFAGAVVVTIALIFLFRRPFWSDITILTRYLSLVVAIYWLGMLFILLGARVTARLAKPHCILNTTLFGIISTIPCFFFPATYPFWYKLLCIFSFVPVSAATGYSVATRHRLANRST